MTDVPRYHDKRQESRTDVSHLLPNDGDVLYRQEVVSFLESFDKQSAEQVFNQVQAIWREQGFLHPRELTAELLKSAWREDDPSAKVKQSIIRELVDAAYQPERMTGQYDAKQHTPLITGLAHIYALTTAKEQDMPVTIVEGDFSNMGGTNLLFQQLRHSDDMTAGWGDTDMVAAIIANNALVDVQAHVEKMTDGKGQVLAVRSGGDELRLIVVGLTETEVQQTLHDMVHPHIEYFTAEAGLHDHIHTKDEHNRYRNGFGLVFGAADMGQERNSMEMLEIAESRINATKLMQGYMRYGELPKGYEALLADQYGGDYVADMIQEYHNYAQGCGQHYEALRPAQTTLEHVYAVAQSYADYKAPQQDPIEPLKDQYVERLPFADIHQVLQDKLEARLLQDPQIGMALSALPTAEQSAFRHAVQGYRAFDPVTHTEMERDLPLRILQFAGDSVILGKDRSVMLYTEMGNAAGYNKLSHAHADAVLREEASIIRDVLESHHLPGDAIHHLGGGKFVTLLPSAVKEHGSWKALSGSMIQTIEQDITNSVMSRINHVPAHNFFQSRGLSTEALQAGQKFAFLKTMEDMPHPKRPFETGVEVTHIQQELNTRERGGSQLETLRRHAEKTLKTIRKHAKEEYEAYGKGTRPIEGGTPEATSSQHQGRNNASGDTTQSPAQRRDDQPSTASQAADSATWQDVIADQQSAIGGQERHL